MMHSGAARKAPNGPHIQVQKASASNTMSGLSVIRRPTIVGVMKCPSMVVSATNPDGRKERLAERGKGDEADPEQDHHHDGRPDIGHVVQQRGEQAEDHRIGQAEEPRAERDDHPERGIDHRDHGQVAGEILLDVVHDLEEAQLGVAVAEQRDEVPARNSNWPPRKNNSVPKNSRSSPTAGVKNATTGKTTLAAGVLTLTTAVACRTARPPIGAAPRAADRVPRASA